MNPSLLSLRLVEFDLCLFLEVQQKDNLNMHLNRLQNVTHLDMIKVIFWVEYKLCSNKTCTKMHLQWKSWGNLCMLAFRLADINRAMSQIISAAINRNAKD